MKILSIILHKSKRLGFNGIETLTYTPEKLYQIILGTNGSGKSSLMAELSPLPSVGTDYFKGGYKEIKIEHLSKYYILTSDFSQKQAGSHSFICEGEELNDGGTTTVQKQLAKEHFDFDKDLFELLTGQTSFREMSPNQRRYWLVRMADDNMEYAIKLYNDINKRQRESAAVVKYLDEQLTTVTQQNPNIEEKQKELTEREGLLKNAHRGLSRIDSFESAVSLSTLEARVNKGFTVLSDLCDDVLSMKYPENYTLGSPENIANHQAQLTANLNLVQSTIDELTEEHTNVKQTVEALIKQEVDDVGSLKILLDDVVNRQQGHLSQLNKFKQITTLNAKSLSDACEIVETQLEEILSELPDNSSKYFNRERLEEARASQQRLRGNIGYLDKEIATKQHILDHLDQGDKVECPSCHQRFLPGMSQYDYETIKGEREKLNSQRSGLIKELESDDTYLTAMQEYLAIHTQLKSLMSSTPVLKPLWDTFANYPLTEYAPTKYLNLFTTFVREVLTLLDAQKLQPNIDEMTQAIKSMQGQSQSETSFNKGALEKIEHKLNKLTLQKHTLTDDLTRTQGYAERFNLVNQLTGKLDKTDTHLSELVSEYYRVGVQDFITKEIDEVNRQLGTVAHELSMLDTVKHHLADLTHERAKAVEQKQLLDLLAKQISPVSGLIADYSLKFITQFTDQMNAIISGVWTYDMQLQPLAMSEDLTYKFPVYMSGSDTQTPDINKLSSAQKRMIDFAFKILLITYLELEDYPLYIDELTPNLDETHRINITNYLKTFVDSGRCSQLFMTSHYVSGHNAFRDAEFVVINSSNLLNVPDEFNVNAVFEYES